MTANQPFNCVIIEDEPLAVTRLEKMLDKSGYPIRVLERLESVSQAVQWFSTHPSPQFVLSDIQLGDGISFQIFEKLQVNCPVIFTTSYDEYAIRAFKIHLLILQSFWTLEYLMFLGLGNFKLLLILKQRFLLPLFCD